MNNYPSWLERKRATTPNLDTAELNAVDPMIRRYFNAERVRVVRVYESGERYERTGRIGVTSGWRPAFLLMHRAGATGSSDVLGPRDRVTHVQYGRTYVPVKNIYTTRSEA